MKLLSVILSLFLAVPGGAATLEWKFAAGDVEHYHVTQAARMLDGKAKPLAEAKQDLALEWRVLSINDDGTAQISIAVSSITLIGQGPDGQEVRYDSHSTKEPEGYATMLGPLGKRLGESRVECTMSRRGEVSDVNLPDELADAVKSIPSGKKFAEDGGVQSFEVLVQLGAPLILPDGEVEDGQEWSRSRSVALPVLGELKAAFQYSITKLVSETEATIAQQMGVAATASDTKIKFAEEKSSGQIVFNIADGRPESSALSYEAKLQGSGESAMALEYSVEFQRVVDETQ